MGNDHTGATELSDAACDVDHLTLAEQALAWRLLLQAASLHSRARAIAAAGVTRGHSSPSCPACATPPASRRSGKA